MRQDVTNTPTALAGITAGTRYAIQNQGLRDVRVKVATAAPATDAELADAAVITGRSGNEIRGGIGQAEGGESIFVYTVNPGETSTVWYDEAV